jgi:hypothetical protein
MGGWLVSEQIAAARAETMMWTEDPMPKDTGLWQCCPSDQMHGRVARKFEAQTDGANHFSVHWHEGHQSPKVFDNL